MINNFSNILVRDMNDSSFDASWNALSDELSVILLRILEKKLFEKKVENFFSGL